MGLKPLSFASWSAGRQFFEPRHHQTLSSGETKRTVLAHGARTAWDIYRLPGVLPTSTVRPGSDESGTSAVSLLLVKPNGGSGEAERNRRCLVKCQILRDLTKPTKGEF